MEVKRKAECRICGSKSFDGVINLGSAPLANSYKTKEELMEAEDFYPLTVYRCTDCGLVQLRDVVSKNKLFREYDYVTGQTSETLPEHFQKYAESIMEKIEEEKPFVIGIGSNDGTLLAALQERGAEVLGVDPASNIAEIANERGVETWNKFFDVETAEKILGKKSKADVVVANNVLGHVDEINQVLEAIKIILKPGGKLFFEVPYLKNLIDYNEFDTIYHEHRSYYSVKPLLHLLRKHGMSLANIEQTDVQGGSIRAVALNEEDNTSNQVKELLEKEKNAGLYSSKTYISFRNQVLTNRYELCQLIERIKEEDKQIIGYGAPAKASIHLNYCNIGAEKIDFVTDEIPLKQDKYIPGTKIPIKNPKEFRNEDVDYALLLAWNYEEEIIEKEKKFLEDGGKFIVPIPKPKVIGIEDLD